MQVFNKILWILFLAGVTVGNIWSFGSGDSMVNNASQEYERICNSDVRGLELLKQMTDFEAANPNHFESKVALGNTWLLLGDDVKASQYLLRAEGVLKNCGDNATGKEHKRVMYYSQALIAGNSTRYDDALTYIDKAIAVQDEGTYQYLKAGILVDQKKPAAAASLFDVAWKNYPESASGRDIRVMVDTYRDAGRFGDAATVLDAIYGKGRYEGGFGVWASFVYEKANQPGKAFLAAWLDLDYGNSQVDLPPGEVKQRLDEFEAYLRKAGTWEESKQDMNAARGIMGLNFDMDIPPNLEGGPIRDYAYLRMALLRPNPNESWLYELQNMEPFFIHCPAYYAAICTAVATHWPEKRAAHLSSAEKVISLGASPTLDKNARRWIGETLGLSGFQGERLLLLTETAALLEEYQRSRKTAALEPLFALFELPDNAYVLSALVLARQNGPLLRDALLARRPAASPRLRERIEFLLQ